MAMLIVLGWMASMFLIVYGALWLVYLSVNYSIKKGWR